MDSMASYLARLVDRLTEAGIEKNSVALTLNSFEEKKLLQELGASWHMKIATAHKAEFMGWTIIVTGEGE